jgi:single-strand DNA-binding protein
MSFSQVIIIGHLGASPELKYTKNKVAILTLSVGTKERLRPSDDINKVAKTYWHKCQLWGKLAESFDTQLSKGDKVFIKGELTYDLWEDKSGRKHKDAILTVQHIEKMYYQNVTIDLG